MVRQILTHYSIARKKAKKRKIVYKSPRIYLSTKLTGDSSFPFKEKDKVRIRIQGKKLIIEKASRKK